MWGLALLFFVASVNSQCADYTYEDQAAWRTLPDCTDNMCGIDVEMQSPITVASKRVASASQLSQLRFTGYEDTAETYNINGQNIQYMYSLDTARLTALNTPEVDFQPEYMLFHIPAEHSIPGVDADAELEFYHKSVTGDAMASVSFFFKITNENNPILDFLNPDVVPVADGTADNVNITGLQAFFDVMQQDYFDSYYYYTGSLTVPPCTQPVYWFLIDSLWGIGADQFNALNARIQNRGNGGNARSTDGRTKYTVLYWDAKENAVSDPVCGGASPQWLEHPYDCTDQYDHTVCFYCSGRANGLEAKSVCLNRHGRNCDELFASPEAQTYCNLAFECPASALSQPFFLLAVLSFLLVAKFW